MSFSVLGEFDDQGWNEETQLDLAMQFIENSGMQSEFREFLRDNIADEPTDDDAEEDFEFHHWLEMTMPGAMKTYRDAWREATGRSEPDDDEVGPEPDGHSVCGCGLGYLPDPIRDDICANCGGRRS